MQEWQVSTTGGDKISGERAAEILNMTRGNLYNLLKRGVLQRAEKPKRAMKRQPLVLFLKDVVDLALEYETITEEEAKKLLDPNAAATVAA